MAIVNIFGSIDVDGLVGPQGVFRKKLVDKYGEDPTVINPSDALKRKIISYAKTNLLVAGYYESSELRKHVRLVSSRRNTLGYQLLRDDIVDKDGKPVTSIQEGMYLAYTYNLSIGANNGDILRWWGHTIDPSSVAQAIISNVKKPASQQGTPNEFTAFKKTSSTFLFASRAENSQDLSDGVGVETNTAFCLTATLKGNVNQNIPYDIEVLILSSSFSNPDDPSSSLLSYPIMKVVVDPTVRIKG